MQYSSGLLHVDWDYYFEKGNVNKESIIKDLHTVKELEFKPGADYLYSNYNPMLLEEIVEKVIRS